MQVWRTNTRGLYDLFDFRTGKLRPVSAKKGLQMFAKFSPDGRKVGFVRDNNLFVTDIATGAERQLTRDGSTDVINGTSDWVYEEELGLKDAFRWSPDSRRIAFWRFDQSAVPAMPIVDELGLYPKVATLRYPKAGEPNSRVKLAVVDLTSDRRTWLDVGPDSGQYLARMEWVGTDSLAVQRIPRRQTSSTSGLQSRVSRLAIRPIEFIKVPMPDGTQLDAYGVAPANFDSTTKYPVLMYVYGGPASPTVKDSWGDSRTLWHQSLAQQSYVVISVDNRGAAWRGSAFRKTTQLHLGMKESQDQIDAAKWIGAQSWGDRARIGIWGWSYGGYLSSLVAGRGGELFKAAIVVSPVTDWRLYDSIYTERFMSTPQLNPEGYRESSSQRYVNGVKARLLLVHGTGDDNVHPQNTMQLATSSRQPTSRST
ncbi:MAG: DPP IV N-terminal domain-containing protein [bacterium]